jgi:hypothetical protein
MKNWISCKMAHHHILYFLLVHSGSIFKVSGMSIKDQHNGLYKVLILPHAISFCCAGPKKSTDQNQEHLRNSNNKFKILPDVPLDFLRGSVQSVSSRLQEFVQNAGVYVEILTLLLVSGPQSSVINCSNTAVFRK